MTRPHTEVSEYADELLSVPRAHLRLELRQDEEGLLLLYDGRTVVRCFLTRQGMTAAGFMARALGVSHSCTGGNGPREGVDGRPVSGGRSSLP